MNRLLRQCREIGIGIVVIDQHPHLISSAALGNTYTSICMNQKDPSDINKAAGLSLVDEEDRKWFSMLPVGQAIVKMQDRWRQPFLVKFPLVNIKKGFVTDSLLSQVLSGSLTRFSLNHQLSVELGQKGRVSLKDIVIEGDALLLLIDIKQHPDDAVRVRYKRLGFDPKKGTRIKEWLISKGIIEEEIVSVGRTRKAVLRITDKARRELELDLPDDAKDLLNLKDNPRTTYRESVAHEYWKRFYASYFHELGFSVAAEFPRKYGKDRKEHGRVDLVATKEFPPFSRSPPPIEELLAVLRGIKIPKPPIRLAIEVETGKSDVVSNVKQDLLANFTKILVIATTEEAQARVARQLKEAGLSNSTKVVICLRDSFKKELETALESDVLDALLRTRDDDSHAAPKRSEIVKRWRGMRSEKRIP